VQAELAVDEGARRLGELALVDVSSRVGATDIVFRNTLFDENAASHIAWGAGLAWTVDHLAPEERAAAGLNDSQTHIDFMVGAPEVEVDGIEDHGSPVPILRDGGWQLT
jgi:aminopeptidase